jgi:hypothetical protein
LGAGEGVLGDNKFFVTARVTMLYTEDNILACNN